MKRVFTTLLTVVAVAGLAQVASAQYMYMDANANGVHDSGDRLNANNTPTDVDIYLSTTLNRDGSPVTCDDPAHPTNPMDVNSYAINIVATGGTVTYGNYINRQSGMPNEAQTLNTGDGTFKTGFFAFVYTTGGLLRLGTLTITGTSGSPKVDFVDILPASQDFTAFGTPCPGIAGDLTYRLDGPNTRAFQGIADWFDSDGLSSTTTAISVALQDAQAEVGLVRLRWAVPDARGSVSTVERRTAVSDWTELGLAEVESGGVVRYEDRSVVPGERYAYRLHVMSTVDQGWSNEVWVLVPSDAGAPLSLRLDPAYPNPFQTETQLNFAVPKSGSVRLTIFNVSGRRVATIIEQGLPSGWRSIAWNGRDNSGRLVPSGTYFAKLEQSGKVQMQKIVVAR